MVSLNKHPFSFQGLSLSGMEKDEMQKKAISTMFSKYPGCSEKYHMCCDTVGAIATASDKGTLFFKFILCLNASIEQIW